MAVDVKTKLLQLKQILGEDAVNKALEEAEKREKAADEAGVESKELGGTRVTTKTDETEAVSLSDLLAEIEAGLEEGTVVDDVSEEGPEDEEAEEAVSDEPTEEELKEFDEYLTELVDARVKEHFDALEVRLKETFVPRQKERDALVGDLQKKLKETTEASARLQSQIDELMGLQPKGRRNGYRASQDTETLLKEGSTLKETRPTPDSMDDFLKGVGMVD